ncbi:MAG: SUMF1/EgtB/PvdO family nonheme iron enzyme [Lentisphaeria bacterium]|nr:SUMF1/EgtB/PvdO family nonheme iron enzyme [Lentisphaeria bacterium]
MKIWSALAFALFTFVFVLTPRAALAKPTAAVFPIQKPRGVRLSAATLDTLWETLTAKLTTAGAYLIVPTTRLKRKLRAQVKRSYKRCYRRSCQIAIGRELAAQKAISTRISRIGRVCLVIIKVWDVRKATAERAATAKGKCSPTALLSAVESAAAQVGGAAEATGKSCGRGMEPVAGHCCWPGQDWGTSSGRCVGTPKCPKGFVRAGALACRPGCRKKGRLLTGGRCCWPGQRWGAKVKHCVGKPARCPRGLEPNGVSCVISPKRGKAGTRWVPLAAGSFQMGSDSGLYENTPSRRVTLKAFAMLKTEVTVGQYRACVRAGSCSTYQIEGRDARSPHDVDSSRWKYTKDKGCNWRGGRPDNHPMNCVSWKQAQAFCRWIGGRLPSETEWEYAARSGGGAGPYPWGDEAMSCHRANKHRCGHTTTESVCSKPAGNSEQGVCDLMGNVGEWIADCYQFGYHGAPTNNVPRTRCTGKFSSRRVTRGGNMNHPTYGLEASWRSSMEPTNRSPRSGFRCTKVR